MKKTKRLRTAGRKTAAGRPARENKTGHKENGTARAVPFSYMVEDKMKKMKTVTCKYYNTRKMFRNKPKKCYTIVKRKIFIRRTGNQSKDRFQTQPAGMLPGSAAI